MAGAGGRIIVEKAIAGDAEWIAGFQVRMAAESEDLALDPEVVVRGVRAFFEEPSRGFYLAARGPDALPVGCLLIQKEWSDWRNAEAWWIHSVYVLPAFRKQGVFREMYRTAGGLARKAGVFALRLYVDTHNGQAQAVYARIGMTSDHYMLYETMLKP